MKILVYCESLIVPSTGTPMREVLKKLIELKKNCHFVLVIRKNSEDNNIIKLFLQDISFFKNWELIVYPVSRFKSNLLGLFRLKEYCQINIKADLYLNFDCNYLGKNAHPLIITVADLSSFSPLSHTSYNRNWQLWLRRFMISNGVKNSEKVIAISDFTKQDIVDRFPDHTHKTMVIHNGINDLWFNHPFIDRCDKKKDYWIWWGRITARKNLIKLLISYGELSKQYTLPDIKIIYGNSTIPSEIDLVLQEYEITDAVHLEKSKHLEDLIDTVTHSKGLLFPSIIEGFGMPVAEAFSRGIPVLTSSTSALKEIAGDLAIFINPEDTKSIKDGMIKLSQLTSTSNDINRRKDRAKEFSLSNSCLKFSNLIDSFANESTFFNAHHRL